MKNEKFITASRLQSIAGWIKGVSLMLMFAAFVACVLDLFLVSPGVLTAPVWGYLVVIGTGVVLQFAGAAVST